MKLTIEDKFAHVTVWRSSGLTQRQYCELHQINFHSLKNWCKLLKKTLAECATGASPELAAAVPPVAELTNPVTNGIIPITVTHQVSVDDTCLDNPVHTSSQLQSRSKQSNLADSFDLLAVNQIKPPPEIRIILTSGLQIQCDVQLLSHVLKVVEHV